MQLIENLPEMVAGIWSEDANLQLETTTLLRKLLSLGLWFSSLLTITNQCFG